MLNTNTSGSVGQPSIADVGGVPYVAFQQPGTGGTREVFVDRWNGTSWVRVGGSFTVGTTTQAENPSIADVNGVPYVAWMQVTIGKGDVYVAHWNGSSWIRNGGALNVSSSSVASFPSIAAVGGVAYVAWSEQAAGQPAQVYVAHWSGSAWVDDGGSLNASATDSARTPSIVGIGAVPYVAWAEDSGSGGAALFVAHFSAGSWTEDVDGYTNPEFNSPVVSHPAAADVGGVPYVAFQESDALRNDVYGGYVSGGEFVPLGGVLNEFSGDEAVGPAIAEVGGGPYVSFTEILPSNEEQLFVKEWNGTTWALVGGALNTGTTDMNLGSSITSVGGVPYVEWSGAGSDGTVSAFDATYLQPSFSDEQAIATDTGALLTVEAKDYDTQLPVAFPEPDRPLRSPPDRPTAPAPPVPRAHPARSSS
jgi:hypothetical protein